MLPDRRYFLVYMHLKKRWMCVCDCDRWFYWYLVGYITRSVGKTDIHFVSVITVG